MAVLKLVEVVEEDTLLQLSLLLVLHMLVLVVLEHTLLLSVLAVLTVGQGPVMARMV